MLLLQYIPKSKLHPNLNDDLGNVCKQNTLYLTWFIFSTMLNLHSPYHNYVESYVVLQCVKVSMIFFFVIAMPYALILLSY